MIYIPKLFWYLKYIVLKYLKNALLSIVVWLPFRPCFFIFTCLIAAIVAFSLRNMTSCMLTFGLCYF